MLKGYELKNITKQQEELSKIKIQLEKWAVEYDESYLYVDICGVYEKFNASEHTDVDEFLEAVERGEVDIFNIQTSEVIINRYRELNNYILNELDTFLFQLAYDVDIDTYAEIERIFKHIERVTDELEKE